MKRKLRHIALLLPFFLVGGLVSFAQTSHTVELQGSEFVPSSLSINVGDTVHWYNTSGQPHNINGSLWYEDNPEPFGIEVGTDWIYSHIFDLPGTYNFHCDVHLDMGMTGIIHVEDGVSSVGEDVQENELIRRVYPIPADDFVVIELQEDVLANYPQLKMSIYDQLGREQLNRKLGPNNRLDIEVRNLNSGLYFFQLVDNEHILYTGKIVVR